MPHPTSPHAAPAHPQPTFTPSKSTAITPQAKFLRDLNRRGDAEAVIKAFEGGGIAQTEAALTE